MINDDNVVELQFRLDFAHYTPPNLDIEDEDEIEIKPDLVYQYSVFEMQEIRKRNHEPASYCLNFHSMRRAP